MTDLVQFQATWDTSNRKKDKSVTNKFTTLLEVSNDDFAEMDRWVSKQVTITVSENDIQLQDIPEVPPEEAYGKMTRSQETRWLLKKIYEAKPRDILWVDFYNQKMNEINGKLKEVLEELQ